MNRPYVVALIHEQRWCDESLSAFLTPVVPAKAGTHFDLGGRNMAS